MNHGRAQNTVDGRCRPEAHRRINDFIAYPLRFASWIQLFLSYVLGVFNKIHRTLRRVQSSRFKIQLGNGHPCRLEEDWQRCFTYLGVERIRGRTCEEFAFIAKQGVVATRLVYGPILMINQKVDIGK
jgi:hypothetical protein